LGRALGDVNVVVRRAAAQALGDLDDLTSAPPGLVGALRSGDAALRHHAANALAEIADPATTPALVELLSDRSSEIRQHVAEALGEIGTPDAVRALTRALEDSDPEVRRAAVEALADAKEND
jgi:HEAT repeat protein